MPHPFSGVLGMVTQPSRAQAIAALEQEVRYVDTMRKQAERQRDMAIRALDTLLAAQRTTAEATKADDTEAFLDSCERLGDAMQAAAQVLASLEAAVHLTKTTERTKP